MGSQTSLQTETTIAHQDTLLATKIKIAHHKTTHHTRLPNKTIQYTHLENKPCKKGPQLQIPLCPKEGSQHKSCEKIDYSS